MIEEALALGAIGRGSQKLLALNSQIALEKSDNSEKRKRVGTHE